MGVGSSPECVARGLRNVSALEHRLRLDAVIWARSARIQTPNVKIWRGSVDGFAIVTCRGFGIRLRDSLNLFLNWCSTPHIELLFLCKVFSCRCDDGEMEFILEQCRCPIGLACVTIDGKFYRSPFVVCCSYQ
jgi:hypothetical protein